jgi:hypothetical protein
VEVVNIGLAVLPLNDKAYSFDSTSISSMMKKKFFIEKRVGIYTTTNSICFHH